jgi:dihydrofolate reductase
MPVEDRAISELMNRHKKVVFSNTLKNFQWTNTKCLKGNIAVVIDALKHEKGKDIMVYGSGQLSQALFEQGLVDELHLWVHPVALGKGKPLFTGLSKFSLCDVKTFRSGVVVHIYGCRPQTV